MAGGSGTRFWPVSTPERPKQFLNLANPEKSLLQESVERVQPLVGDDVFIATAERFVEATLVECPSLAPGNIFGEPHKRNTLGALVWTTANLMAQHGDWRSISTAILTADHLIQPEQKFLDTVSTALDVAEESGSLVTIGVPATRPATEYGYIECGESLAEDVWDVKRFTEKPDEQTANDFLETNNYFWNSGMFFWTLEAFHSQLKTCDPQSFVIMGDIASLLHEGEHDKAAERFADLTSTSVDYALMEKAEKVSVVEAKFDWDDLGSWDALSRGSENTTVGDTKLIDSNECVIYNDTEHMTVNVLGMEDVVIVVTDREVMVCPKSRAQDVKKFSD